MYEEGEYKIDRVVKKNPKKKQKDEAPKSKINKKKKHPKQKINKKKDARTTKMQKKNLKERTKETKESNHFPSPKPSP